MPVPPCAQVKQMAAVLLRRLLSSSFEEIYPGLAETMQMAIKTELLSSIQQETSPNIRKKVCDIAAELSRNLIGNRLALPPTARHTFEVAAAQTSASLIIFFFFPFLSFLLPFVFRRRRKQPVAGAAEVPV